MEFSSCACISKGELSATFKHELSATLIDDVHATRKAFRWLYALYLFLFEPLFSISMVTSINQLHCIV